MGSLQPWIDHRRKEGVSVGTIDHGLKVIRRIVNLASTEWIDEEGLTWLAVPPKSDFYRTMRSGSHIHQADTVCEMDGRKPELVVPRGLIHSQSPQNPHSRELSVQ
jgi:hypothetical protein